MILASKTACSLLETDKYNTCMLSITNMFITPCLLHVFSPKRVTSSDNDDGDSL